MRRWLRLAVFSLVGIIVSMVLLSFITPKGYNMYGNMNNMSQPMGMQGMSSGAGMNTMTTSSQPQGGMGGMMGMGNMQQTSLSAMPMGNTSTMSTTQSGDTPMMIMQKLNEIQMQLNQLQQMMNSSASGSAPMPSGGGMGMM